MKRTIKRISLAVFVLAMLISFATFANASDVKMKVKQDGITWTLYSSGTLTVSGEGEVTSMPDALQKVYTGKSKKNLKIKKVKVNKGFKRIAYGVFKNGKDVTEATIADSVKVIKADVFSGCKKLKTVKLPKNMKAITNYVFHGCKSLENVTFPEKLEIIRNGAFEGCTSLKKITLPKTLKKIKIHAFSGCYNLEAPTLPNSLEYLSGFDGCYFKDGFTIPKNVKTIGCNAFEKTYISKIEIPNSVETIETEAFKDCDALEKVSLPSSLTTMGHNAFYGCTSLKKITIPSSLKTISSSTFYGCEKLETVKISSGVESIMGGAFNRCSSLKKVDVPKSVKFIGEHAFYRSAGECIVIRNPECELSKEFVGVDYDPILEDYEYEEDEIEKFKSLTDTVIIGYNGSTAEKYAKEIGLKFVPLNKNSTEHYFTKTKVVKKATTESSGEIKLICPCGYSETSSVDRIEFINFQRKELPYNGKNQKPTVYIRDCDDNLLTQGVDYTVKYPKKSKNVGQYTATVTFKGKYSGTKKLTYAIVPQEPTISKITAGKKQFQLKWKKQDAKVTGYQIQYSTSIEMKNPKTITLKDGSATSATVKGLKSGKTYYFHIRAYTTVTVNSKQVKLYSSWLYTRMVKVK